jgi:hypothetical protein
MILYVQTPAIPRSELHNTCIKTMMSRIDTLHQFSEIRWIVNIDVIKTSSGYSWEDVNITIQNLQALTLNKTHLTINVSYAPCFYLAFRHLTQYVLNDIQKHELTDNDYCVMWLEDDWTFTDFAAFNQNLDIFLSNINLHVYTLADFKINMGGNPDIIKGNIFKHFKYVNLSPVNKRDPENIRKHDVWYPYVFNDLEPKTETTPYTKLLDKLIAINNDIHHPMRKLQTHILSSSVVEGITGDKWRANIAVQKNWNTNDKHGITSDRNYTYK